MARRLTAVEGLGSCTFIATDKTGTLTANELTVREIRLADGSRFEATGEGFTPEGEVRGQDGVSDPTSTLEPFTRVAVLCNEADLHSTASMQRVCEQLGNKSRKQVELIATGYTALTDGLWLDILVTPEDMDRELARRISTNYMASFYPEHFKTL